MGASKTAHVSAPFPPLPQGSMADASFPVPRKHTCSWDLVHSYGGRSELEASSEASSILPYSVYLGPALCQRLLGSPPSFQATAPRSCCGKTTALRDERDTLLCWASDPAPGPACLRRAVSPLVKGEGVCHRGEAPSHSVFVMEGIPGFPRPTPALAALGRRSFFAFPPSTSVFE